MTLRCPSCDAMVADGARVCAACGAELEADPWATSPELERGARRDRSASGILLTVLAILGGMSVTPFVMDASTPLWLRLPLGALLVVALATGIAAWRGSVDARVQGARKISMRVLASIGALSLALAALMFGSVILVAVLCAQAAK